MPILPEERNILPDDLLTADAPPQGTSPEGERRWWAVYTKARQEKALARDLVQYEVPFYLPLVTKMTLVRGKRVPSLAPLFTGYLFLYASEDERVQALKTNRTSQLVTVPDQEQLRKDLRQVQRLILSKAPLTVEQRIAPGHKVRVKAGPFMGIEGVVETRRGGYRLIVAVNFLQQGVSVELDELMVERLD